MRERKWWAKRKRSHEDNEWTRYVTWAIDRQQAAYNAGVGCSVPTLGKACNACSGCNDRVAFLKAWDERCIPVSSHTSSLEG